MNNIQSPSPAKISRPIPYTRYSILSLLLVCALFSLQCKKELTTSSSSAKLSFSTNLLFFDTVFAGGNIGSSVRAFLVHNNNNEAVNISSIKLQGNYSSFEINVDGVAGTTFSNVKIPANDSIYVFAQVNVNTLNTNNPLVIEDSLVFTTNGNIQCVHLQAFGWNAYYYTPTFFPPNGPAYSFVQAGTNVWKNDKPHVIFGYLVDTLPLTVEQGTHIYFHDSAVLYIYSGSSLNVTGTSANPVTFQGDRLEPAYQNLPGQWGGIFLSEGSANNNISWAVIQNGTTGITADTDFNANPTLTIDHTIIKGMSSVGLLGSGATITANNCLIADCQSPCVVLEYGGNYHFYQCTFADYWGIANSYGQRTAPILYLNNNYVSATGIKEPRGLDSAVFGNCIIYGALNEEVGLDSNYGAAFNYYFRNCVIKTQHTYTSIHDNNMLFYGDPLFANPSVDNYQVNQGSSAIGNGNSSIGALYPIDLNGLTGTPPYTIGAYQK